MDDFETRKLVRGAIASGSSNSSGIETWPLIRQSSIRSFAERTARNMGARRDKMLLRKLTEMALTSGEAEFDYDGHRYTAKHVLMIYSQGREPDGDASFKGRALWTEFAEGMRKLRDPREPVIAREHLLAIGQRIEARQRPHAQQRGWA